MKARIRSKSNKKELKKDVRSTKSSSGRRGIVIPKLVDDFNNIEIYIKYSRLDSRTWVHILDLFEKIKKEVIRDYQLENELTNNSLANFKVTPTLDIQLIHTGRSVIIRFKEGWKPKFKAKKGDFIIEVPYRVALPGLILYSLYFCYDKSLDLRVKRLDIQIKQQELKNRIEETGKRLHPTSASRTTIKFISYVKGESDIKYLRINKLVIKDLK